MKYWFLYNLSDGSIYGAPYSGNAEEWTNIPKGCAVLGGIDASTASAEVIDAFNNPSHYTVANRVITAVSNIINLQLTNAINNKLGEMTNTYNQDIYGTFTSTAFDGTTSETYSCSATDQVRINGEVTMAMAVKASFSTETISWKNTSQIQCITWTADAMIKLGTDLHAYITAKTDYLEALMVYINSLKTVDDVNKVTWEMTIPS